MQLHQSGTTNASSGTSSNTEAQRFFTILDPTADEFDFRFIIPATKKDSLPAGAKAAFIHRGSVRVCDLVAKDANDKGYGVYVTVNRTDGDGAKDKNIMGEAKNAR